MATSLPDRAGPVAIGFGPQSTLTFVLGRRARRATRRGRGDAPVRWGTGAPRRFHVARPRCRPPRTRRPDQRRRTRLHGARPLRADRPHLRRRPAAARRDRRHPVRGRHHRAADPRHRRRRCRSSRRPWTPSPRRGWRSRWPGRAASASCTATCPSTTRPSRSTWSSAPSPGWSPIRSPSARRHAGRRRRALRPVPHLRACRSSTTDSVLVGIITNRDLRFIGPSEWATRQVREVMTPMPLVTAPVGIGRDDAAALLAKHKIEKLPIVDADGTAARADHGQGLREVRAVPGRDQGRRRPTACRRRGRVLGRRLGAGHRARRRRRGRARARHRQRPGPPACSRWSPGSSPIRPPGTSR